MKQDKFKNKSKARFIPENEKHGKRDIRHSSKQNKRIKNIDIMDDEAVLELDDFYLDKFEKMG